jgi:hypothetical protein
MSCPVKAIIADLYKTGRYEGGETPGPQTILFYITRRRLEFARGKIIASVGTNTTITTTTNTLIDDATVLAPTLMDDAIANPYHERMFKDYRGVTSHELFQRLFNPICTATSNQFVQTADMIIIAEAVCSAELARDFPDGMSLPEIAFDPDTLCDDSDPMKIINEINKMIVYANKLRVCGLSTAITPVKILDKKLREFTIEGDFEAMLASDMEVAEYALEVEQVHFDAAGKMAEIVQFLQKIVDVGNN